MKRANKSYGDWFQQKLDTEVSDLSLEQLFTVLQNLPI
jgi:hypothetical protein